MKITNHYTIVSSIYANYIIQSIAVIVTMQFSFAFTEQLHTDLIGLGFAASGIGIGKILCMFLAGLFSDQWGRKYGILTGMGFYIIFFVGLIFCTSVTEAFLLTVLAGIGNAFLDTGSMPALTELFPAAAGSASVLIKAFISLGTLILPFIVTFIYQSGVGYGYVFVGIATLLLINGAILSQSVFPEKIIFSGNNSNHFISPSNFIKKPQIFIEGTCLVLMGFTITATFVIVMQWLPDIAMRASGMEELAAKKLISNYSTGSIVAVFVIAYCVKKLIKPIYCIVLFPFLSSITLGIFLFLHSELMCKIVAYIMGFTAGGGVLQLAVVVMQQLFPSRKGLSVGIMYTLSGLAFAIVPLIVPSLTIIDVRQAILFNFLMAFLSTLFGAVVLFRVTHIIGLKHLPSN